MFDPHATTIERSFGRSLIHPNAKNHSPPLHHAQGKRRSKVVEI